MKATVERLVLLTPRGPLIVHLEICIQGQPQRALAEQVLQEAAQAAGGDGQSDPTWAQLVANPRFAAGQWGNSPFKGPADERRIIEQFDVNRDGRVQPAELASFLAQDNAEGRAFVVQPAARYGEDRKPGSPLFALLDDDQDGRISAAEMAAAAGRLRSRDANDDDVVTMADFRPSVSGDQAMRGRRNFESRRAFALNKLEVDSIYYALGELYDMGNGLDASSFALAPGVFASLDTDRNGAVDQEEIAGLVDVRPDLVFKVDFASVVPGEQQPALKILSIGDDLVAAGASARAEGGRLVVELPGSKLDVSAIDLATEVDPLDAATARFAMLDVDKNDVLEGDELKALGSADALKLEEIDSNGDGKVSLEEIKKAFGKQRSYRALQVQVRVGDAEDSLFNWLDANHDGRLTVREMLGAAERLAELDRDGDGAVSAAEIPDRLECAIIRGAPAKDATTFDVPVAGRKAGPDAPRWLVAMDTSGDGEISPREFLGTPEQFSQLDTNGDGFIDADEARQLSESFPP
jgi:Ca2+-binding EF-hand superfamily protein